MYASELRYLQSEDYQNDKYNLNKEHFLNDISDKLNNNYCLDLSTEGQIYFNYSDWLKFFNKLQFNNSIEDLYLMNCNLYCSHAFLIAKMIKENKKLDDLDLSNNFIRDEGAKAIIEALKKNNSVDTIWLNDNYISDEYMDFFKNYNEGK
jgi:hypothetical protein